MALGQWAAAIAIARRVLAARPGHDEARALLAQSEAALAQGTGIGRNDPCPCGSGKRYKACHGAPGALDAKAASPDALVARAMAAHQRGELDAAERDYRAALAAAPEHPHALHYLGVIEWQRGRPEAALPMLERAAALVPQEPEFHNNLGLVLSALDRPAEAAGAHRRALALAPGHAGAWNNLGLALQAGNHVDEAADAFRRALALAPDFTQARWNLALALLARGPRPRGLAVLRGAPRGRGVRRPRPAAGHAALGRQRPARPHDPPDARAGTRRRDPVRALRPAARGARRPRDPAGGAPAVALVPGRSPAWRTSWPPTTRALRTTRGCRCSRSPGRSGWAPTDIPAQVPYLAAAPRGARKCNGRWGRGRDASCARDSPGRAIRATRTTAAARSTSHGWSRCSTCPACAGSRSPRGDGEDQLARVPQATVLERLDARNDFDGTAAMLAALDLVVTVDTSIAHLAGALARPTFVMLPFAADWRWRTDAHGQPVVPDAAPVPAGGARGLGERRRGRRRRDRHAHAFALSQSANAAMGAGSSKTRAAPSGELARLRLAPGAVVDEAARRCAT